MHATTLPPVDVMTEAFLARDASFEGVFVTAVRTTGIFCRPTCPARKPLPGNVDFFSCTKDALFAGYRPCKRCRPLEPIDTPPEWLRPLLALVDSDPSRRWRDSDLRAEGLGPERVRRWFQQHHDMTFHAYNRARRLGLALGQIRQGDSVLGAALDAGYESLSGFNSAFRQVVGEAPTSASRGAAMVINRISTPLGPMVAVASESELYLLEFADRRMLESQLRTVTRRLGGTPVPGKSPVLDELALQLEAYFAGSLRAFSIPMCAPGTPFQEEVWAQLQRVPYGETTTYASLATAIGRPTAVRAAGRANGDNRMTILIPCHRVIGSDGGLTGYGGGLGRKRRLLDLEASGLGLQR